MNARYQVDTPEAVDIGYRLAGLGSRGLAAMIDSFCIASYLLVVFWAAIGFGAVSVRLRWGSAASDLAIVIFILGSFLLIWGYYVLLESIWHGQTIGKRALKLRVVRVTGESIGFMDSFIRNIVRVVDFLPAFYGVGVVSMFISSQSRRLGDYAAGTLVIRERIQVKLSDLKPAASAIPLPDRGDVDPDELRWDLRALSPQEIQVARTFLHRAPTLPQEARARLGGEIASRVAAAIGARDPFDSERFLDRVLTLRELE